MVAWISQLLAAPVLEDEEKTRVARLLHATLLALLATLVVVVLSIAALHRFPSTPADLFTLLSGLVLTVAIGALLLLARRGYVRLTSMILLALLWQVITIWIGGVSGISGDNSSLIYALIIVLGGLLLGGRAAIVLTLLSTLAVAGAYYAEISGWLVVEKRPLIIIDLLLTAVPLILTGLLLRYAVHSLVAAMERARRNERAQIEANRELEALRTSLEARVADRTRDLERRTVQLQAAAEVSRAITSILDIEQLIWQVAELIHDRFGLYHVGVFQMDTAGRWAEYRAGAGEGGQLLAEQRFRLEVGGPSMIGWCTARAQARVAQDISVETGRIDHPLVPATRSEAALPLITRGQIIGALSVQSDRPGTFDPETVATLQTIADQVAVALDNARLFTESQEALEATRRAYGELSRQAWADRLRTRADWGYSYTYQSLAPIQGDWPPEMLQAVQTGQIVQGPADSTGKPMLAIPLKVREETIGVLSFYKDGPDAWPAEETRFLERLVQQLGLALESARLYEETQRRAAREQTIRHVTEQMRRAVDIEAILQNTVTELAKAMGTPRAYVRLGTGVELEPNDPGSGR